MKKLILVLIVLAVGVVIAALNFHIVQLDNSIRILKKVDMTISDTYVDARGMKKIHILSKPALIKAGIQNLFDDDSVTIKK